MKNYNSKKIQCQHCQKEFKSAKTLRFHIVFNCKKKKKTKTNEYISKSNNDNKYDENVTNETFRPHISNKDFDAREIERANKDLLDENENMSDDVDDEMDDDESD
jgi:hypothetical protein